jgi:RecB family exonuclease
MSEPNQSGLGAVLSPSQTVQFLNCPAKWMFRYLLNLKESGTAATALGTAFHETVAHNYRQKINTAQDLPPGELLGFLREVLSQQLEDAVLLPGEHPLELLEVAEVMLTKYLNEAAPLIQPAAVETKVSGTIGGVRVYGYVDLLDTDGRIIDSKSALKPFKGISHDHRFQLTSYAMITPAATGQCRLDTITKGKTVNLVQKSFTITDADRKYVQTVYPMVQDSIGDGIFLPRRNGALCSRRYCGFWRSCEKEFYGVVKD